MRCRRVVRTGYDVCRLCGAQCYGCGATAMGCRRRYAHVASRATLPAGYRATAGAGRQHACAQRRTARTMGRGGLRWRRTGYERQCMSTRMLSSSGRHVMRAGCTMLPYACGELYGSGQMRVCVLRRHAGHAGAGACTALHARRMLNEWQHNGDRKLWGCGSGQAMREQYGNAMGGDANAGGLHADAMRRACHAHARVCGGVDVGQSGVNSRVDAGGVRVGLLGRQQCAMLGACSTAMGHAHNAWVCLVSGWHGATARVGVVSYACMSAMAGGRQQHVRYGCQRCQVRCMCGYGLSCWYVSGQVCRRRCVVRMVAYANTAMHACICCDAGYGLCAAICGMSAWVGVLNMCGVTVAGHDVRVMSCMSQCQWAVMGMSLVLWVMSNVMVTGYVCTIACCMQHAAQLHVASAAPHVMHGVRCLVSACATLLCVNVNGRGRLYVRGRGEYDVSGCHGVQCGRKPVSVLGLCNGMQCGQGMGCRGRCVATACLGCTAQMQRRGYARRGGRRVQCSGGAMGRGRRVMVQMSCYVHGCWSALAHGVMRVDGYVQRVCTAGCACGSCDNVNDGGLHGACHAKGNATATARCRINDDACMGRACRRHGWSNAR